MAHSGSGIRLGFHNTSVGISLFDQQRPTSAPQSVLQCLPINGKIVEVQPGWLPPLPQSSDQRPGAVK
ncbi:hypothetical protein RFM23_28880, partial [Mesorhizobium abyssinicae]|nr:hypothetical protein [Mesorhizobium abyssinicae]